MQLMGGILIKHSVFMSIAAVLALLVGLALALIPAQLLSIYSIALEADGEWIARCLGSVLLCVEIAAWLGRTAPQGVALNTIMTGDFVLSVTGPVMAILFSIRGSGNALVWSTTAICAFLTAGLGYLCLSKPGNSQNRSFSHTS
jgi:hypothetical protein